MSDDPGDTVLGRILGLLDGAGVAYRRIEHAAASSAQEAAAVRGTPLALGVKAILFKVDGSFAVFAFSAERALHSAKIRKRLKVRRTRFATREELLELTGLRPGAVPPFGEPVLPFPLYADPSFLERPELVFTAGSRTTSIRLATEDYLRLATPVVLPFSR